MRDLTSERERYKSTLDKRLGWEGIPPAGEYYEQVLSNPRLFSMYEFRLEHYKTLDSSYAGIVKSLTTKWPEWGHANVHARAREIYIRNMAKKGPGGGVEVWLCSRIQDPRLQGKKFNV